MPPLPATMSNSAVGGCRTMSQHLNDLKKENFSLKLRIYFLEEKIQQKFEDSSDDVHRTVSVTAEGFLGENYCSRNVKMPSILLSLSQGK